MSVWSRLYDGETTIRFVPRIKLWFTISGVVIAIGLVSLGARGLNLGLDFEGGTSITVATDDASVEEVRDEIEALGVEAKVLELTSEQGRRLRVQTEFLDVDDEARAVERLMQLTGAAESAIEIESVGASWGRSITEKAARALVFFLLAILVYVTVRFELKMALATMLALFHDILVTLGVYSLFGFEVTPATVTAFLTILGFSIYDGIVVFDRVDENSRLVSSTTRTTYSDMVDISLNQTLMRSLNTQITAIVPMLSLLLIGSLALGATTLQEFALALVVGQFSGAYSSIFIASPVLALLKEREPRFKDVRRRIEARDASTDRTAPAERSDDDLEPAAAPIGGASSSGGPPPTAAGTIPPRPRKKKRR